MQGSFDQDGWWEICQSLRPDMTREQFDASWEHFQTEKSRRAAQGIPSTHPRRPE